MVMNEEGAGTSNVMAFVRDDRRTLGTVVWDMSRLVKKVQFEREEGDAVRNEVQQCSAW